MSFDLALHVMYSDQATPSMLLFLVCFGGTGV
jgi:hypothetical protein